MPGAELTRVRRGCHDAQLALTVEGDDRAVEPDMDLDELAGVTRRAGPVRQLEDSPREPDGVVAGDLAAILEDEDSLEPDLGRNGPPGGDRVGRRDREARIVTGQVRAQEGIRAGQIGHAGQPEFRDEAVLEGPPQTLDPTLGLR